MSFYKQLKWTRDYLDRASHCIKMAHTHLNVASITVDCPEAYKVFIQEQSRNITELVARVEEIEKEITKFTGGG